MVDSRDALFERKRFFKPSFAKITRILQNDQHFASSNANMLDFVHMYISYARSCIVAHVHLIECFSLYISLMIVFNSHHDS